ncbi:MAG: hypothetical protein KJ070_03705 [Verrucomicrobia bacterium]|nr:hypothetical protein [Verrucomicrobiota bacterium]
MNERPEFRPTQAEEIARAFGREGVNYLFIGKSGAILLGYPGTTQDVDIFPERSPENGRRIVAALRSVGFEIAAELEREIVRGKDLVQIKSGPFDVDLVYAPDGIASFEEASGRDKDKVELEMLEDFRYEYEKRHALPLRTASELAKDKPSRSE